MDWGGAFEQSPGGYDIDRLPLRVLPLHGEHTISWLTRWAHRYGLSPGQLLTRLGAPTPAAPMARIEKHLLRYRTTITRAAGLTALPTGFDTNQRGGQLDRYMAGYHDLRRPPVNRTRFCPACLAESGGAWRHEWTLALQLVCSRHQVLLVRCCPDCRRQRFASPAWMSSISPPWVCSEPVPDGHTCRSRFPACGRDLRTVPTVPVSLDDILLQARLWHMADEAAEDPEVTTAACGFDVTRRDLFDAVLELTVEHLGEPGRLYRRDTDPQTTIAALRAAFTVVDQADAAAAAGVAGQHRLLHPAGTVTPIGPDHVLTRRRRNPLLASIRLGSLGPRLSPSSQLVFRTGSERPRYPAARTSPTGPPPPGATQLAWIPQQLWPDQLTPWIPNSDHRGRAAAALMLAKVGSTRPWRAIAIDLGLPASFASYPPTLVRHLQREHVWPAVVARLDELATRLEADPPPIDYQTRRWTAASQDLLVAAVNHARAELDPVHGWVSILEITQTNGFGGRPQMSANPTVKSGTSTSLIPNTGDSALVTEQGKTTIADTVVAKIAGIATREVSGVHALGGGASRAVGALRGRIPGGRTNYSQGVAVEVGERQAAVDIQLVADYGVSIADLAAGIRRNVISAVERMTGLDVTEVNIEVQDVYLPSDDDDDQDEQDQGSRVQ